MVTESPWYVIRMPGGVGGGESRGSSLSRLAEEIDLTWNKVWISIAIIIHIAEVRYENHTNDP
jgi:hypothetical protein